MNQSYGYSVTRDKMTYEDDVYERCMQIEFYGFILWILSLVFALTTLISWNTFAWVWFGYSFMNGILVFIITGHFRDPNRPHV